VSENRHKSWVCRWGCKELPIAAISRPVFAALGLSPPLIPVGGGFAPIKAAVCIGLPVPLCIYRVAKDLAQLLRSMLALLLLKWVRPAGWPDRKAVLFA